MTALPPVQLVVGLGNPGLQYANSRHNMGFMVVDSLAQHLQVSLTADKRKFHSIWGETRLGGRKLILAFPQTYMNLSGGAVAALAAYYRIEPAAIVVVYDDLDLAFGRLKINISRGAGGHKGIASIIEHLDTTEFVRLRVGIDRPRFNEPAERYVLANFYPEQKEGLGKIVDTARECLLTMVEEGANSAMQKYNRNY